MSWKGFLLKVSIFLCVQSVLSTCPHQQSVEQCFTKSDFDKALIIAREEYEKLQSELESALHQPGFTMTEKDAGYPNFLNIDIDQDVFDINSDTSIVLSALKILKENFSLNRFQLEDCLEKLNIDLEDCTKIEIFCDPEELVYYRVNGQCNNMKHPLFGAKKRPLNRLFGNGYADKIDYSNSSFAKSARSNARFANKAKRHMKDSEQDAFAIINEYSTAIGQVYLHEITRTIKYQVSPRKRDAEGGLMCCNAGNDPSIEHFISINKACAPIGVSDRDSCYKEEKISCLNYYQVMRGLNKECHVDTSSAPISVNTPFFDAETVYSKISLNHLKEHGGRFNFDNYEEIKLTIIDNDGRNNQVPGVFQYIHYFLKLHNLIFDFFKQKQPDEDNRVLVLRTRMIVTAVYQNLLVEFGKMVLCKFLIFYKNCKIFTIFLQIAQEQAEMLDKLMNGNCYDENLDPQVSVEFNICMRFFHYFIRETYATYDENSVRDKNRQLHPRRLGAYLDNNTWIEKNYCGVRDALLDRNWNQGGIGEEVSCKLYSPSQGDKKLGLDIRSMDHQFARIAGEPKYIEVLRHFYGIDKCDEDYEKSDFIKHSKKASDILFKRVDNKPQDIGLTMGLEFENPGDEILKPTCSKIIGDQFKKSICGDRFFFAHYERFKGGKNGLLF